MNPVAIFRHARSEGPGFLADFLKAHHIPWQLVRIDAGDPLPPSVQPYSGLVFMGGPMSVNDDLPWIPSTLNLIREAVAADVPVLGHCLGGQLMARALGGSVGRNPVKEIGWGEVAAADNTEACRWLGSLRAFNAFHWHGETFSIPVGATHILASEYCPNQAFALGKHLGFQCHVEMTASMVREWCALGAEEMAAAATSPGVQQADQMFDRLDERILALNQVAQTVYERWIDGLAV